MSIADVAKAIISTSNPVIGIAISYWKPILYVLALLGAYWGGYHREAENCAAQAAALREKQEQAIIDQQVRVIAGERAATVITTGVSNDYENQISIIDKRYDALRGMHGTVTGSPVIVSAIPAATGGYHGSAKNNGFTFGVGRLEIERQIDEQTQRLISCQAWIKQQLNARAQ